MWLYFIFEVVEEIGANLWENMSSLERRRIFAFAMLRDLLFDSNLRNIRSLSICIIACTRKTLLVPHRMVYEGYGPGCKTE